VFQWEEPRDSLDFTRQSIDSIISTTILANSDKTFRVGRREPNRSLVDLKVLLYQGLAGRWKSCLLAGQSSNIKSNVVFIALLQAVSQRASHTPIEVHLTQAHTLEGRRADKPLGRTEA